MTIVKAKKVNTSTEVAKAATAKPEIAVLVKESELYKTEKAIQKAIDETYITATELNKKLQVIALSLHSHAMTTGDVTVIERGISRLFEKFSKGMRKDAMYAWFDKFSCVDIVRQEVEQDNGKTKMEYVVKYSKEKREKLKKEGWYLPAAQTWWYNAAKEAEYIPFNLDEYLIKVAGYLQKKAKSPKEGDVIDSVAIESVVNAINQTVSKHKEQVAVAA
jgi:hypothetical protein